MENHASFVSLQPKNGTITIPAAVRRLFGLDQPGAQVEIVVRDSEIALIPHVAVPADQRWFWTPEWQAMEREADQDLAAGRFTDFATGEEFLAHLTKIASPESDKGAQEA
ncbi:MAG: AbrB/MazE/SpoVT family DNA-binding domain-containing protein [Mycobacteriales bacterium]